MRVAIVGAGVVGLATSAELLKHGVDVTCFEKSAPMAERSAGSSRIFRLAHVEPDLVELAAEAREYYRVWGERAGVRLVDNSEVVISGARVDTWASAMSTAGAAYSIVDGTSKLLRLPTRKLPSRSLIDHSGGILQVAKIGAILTEISQRAIRAAHVYALEDTERGVRVWSAGSDEEFDTAIICAGSGTSILASHVGIYTPAALAHHARFTFRLRPHVEELQCWISTSEEGLDTYQHMSAPGQWAIGAHIDLTDTAWEVGARHAIETSRCVVSSYVEETLELVESAVLDHLYCTITPELGDGFKIQRSGRVLAVYGENLFKLAPVLGKKLALAALDGSTPLSAGTLH